MIPDVDWVIDCAANPSVTAGAHSNTTDSSRQLIEHNLLGTVNLLEFCRERYAGLVLLSSSRVYSVNALRRIPLREGETRFEPVHPAKSGIPGYSQFGISEDFPTTAPVSLYGATKLASETLALEYGHTFSFPVWIDRCGVIGGPGQFGKVDQGILSFWVYSFLLNRPLKYIGFDGSGKQVRDFVRAEDVASLVAQQILDPARCDRRIFNVGGGNANAFSLLELSKICRSFFHSDMGVESSSEERVFDIPYYVTDIRRVEEHWDWSPSVRGRSIVTQVCEWADVHRDFVASLT
jgi:CDP-paratose 2-epimerase